MYAKVKEKYIYLFIQRENAVFHTLR